jgi:hypothetical protein
MIVPTVEAQSRILQNHSTKKALPKQAVLCKVVPERTITGGYF